MPRGKARAVDPERAQVETLRQLHETAVAVARSEDWRAALSRVLEAAVRASRSTMGMLWLCEEGRSGLRLNASVGHRAEFLRAIEQAPEGVGACGTVLARGERLVVEDAATDPLLAAYRDAWPIAGFVSSHSVPLRSHDGQVMGVMTVQFVERHVPDEREQALVDLYAQLAADVVARTRATRRLKEGEERFRALAQHAPVGIFLSDAKGDSVFLNEAWCRLAGLTEEEARGKGWAKAIHPDDREWVEREWNEAVREGRPSSAEYRFVRPDGSFCWLHGNAVQLRDAAGRVTGHIGTVVDITERRRGEERVRQLAAIVEGSEDAILSTDLQGTITSWNRGAERLYGYTREEAIGQPLRMLLPAGREQEEPAIGDRISRGERIEHYETTRLHKSGRLLDVSLTVSPLLGADGRPIGASKIARDITERKRHEAELRRQQQLYRAIGESIDFGIWVCDAEGKNIYISESFLKLVGMTQEEVSGDGWTRVLAPDQVGPMMEAWKRCVATGGFWEREHLFKGVDGQWHPVLARGVPIRDEDGRVVYWAGINLDIAAFKKTEAALRQGEEQLRLVTDNAIVFLAHCDREYRLRFVNRPYAQRFGRTPEELVGKRIEELIGPAAFEVFKPRIDEALGGRRVEFEMEIPYERFGRRWMRIIHEPERDAAGGVSGVVAVITDITARKQAERDMEAARDKAEAASRAKDDFLAALSHELRTPLNPVLLLASEHAGDPALPDEAQEAFRTIRKNVELEARLIDDLLDLTRITRGKLSLNLAMQDAHAILQDAVATIRPELEAKGLTLMFELHAKRTKVWADAVRLQQVLWNVLKNAVKFTSENGEVRVITRDLREDGRIRIEIRDTGIGMTAAELRRVFDAFSQGDHANAGGSHRFGGVGLGLAISRMIVQMHRGSIRAESEGRDHGSVFTIELPLGGESEEDAEEMPRGRAATMWPFRSAEAGAGGARRKLLLVEDHEPTRAALAQLLRRRDFEVVPAATVQEGREAAAAGGVDLVISDIGLPDGNGYELMTELKREYGLRGIALTGYGMDHDLLRSQAAGFVVHLTKPVTVQALEKALRAAMAEP